MMPCRARNCSSRMSPRSTAFTSGVREGSASSRRSLSSCASDSFLPAAHGTERRTATSASRASLFPRAVEPKSATSHTSACASDNCLAADFNACDCSSVGNILLEHLDELFWNFQAVAVLVDGKVFVHDPVQLGVFHFEQPEPFGVVAGDEPFPLEDEHINRNGQRLEEKRCCRIERAACFRLSCLLHEFPHVLCQ